MSARKINPNRDNRKVFPHCLIPKSGKCGVYGIICNSDGRLYVGGAKDLYDRYSTHKYKLNKKEHCNRYLQQLHNENPECLEFFVIEEIRDASTLREREQFWMDFYQSYQIEHGFNINPNSKSPLGFKMTEEGKAKIGAAHRGVPNVKCSKPVTQWSLDGKELKTFPSSSEAGRQLGMPISAVSHCLQGKSKITHGFKWTYAAPTI
jgi:hypothetical protein